MKKKEYCKIIEKSIYNNYLILKIETENIAKNSKPGQFVNIRGNDTFDPLLRRPISICDVSGNILTLMILIKGKGTNILASRNTGESLNIIGPLGNAFPTPDKKPMFIAGGIGIAPFLYFSRDYEKPLCLFGIKSKDYMPHLDEFQRAMDIKISSDDGSVGVKGNVTGLLEKVDNPMDYTIYACGPTPMLRALSKIFDEKYPGIKAYFSLETYMACGFGACKGCVVETKDGEYKLACKDGPVFLYNEVKL